MYQHGWYHVAYERDLQAELTPIEFEHRKLMCIRADDGVAVVDAICPHRGAHLAYGGKRDGDIVICPFHGHRIGWRPDASCDFQARRYTTLVQGGLVYVLLSDAPTPDLPAFLRQFAAEHDFYPGFELPVNTSLEMVMENGFDSLHFKYVHAISNEPEFAFETGAFGELVVTGVFEFPSWNSRKGVLELGHATYRGCVFSPGVGFGSLSGDEPYNYTVITTAVPGQQPNTCTVRVTLALPSNRPGGPTPGNQLVNNLLAAMRDGLEKDRLIWDHLSLDSQVHWTPRDRPAIELNKFCRAFRA
jgi:3-ketosteroid 9alpha-monooxygenase subunit A